MRHGLTPLREGARLESPVSKTTGHEEQAMPERRSHRFVAVPALAIGLALSGALGAGGCATVQLQAPKEPITINLNVKIDQEVRYRLDKDLEDAIAANPDLF